MSIHDEIIKRLKRGQLLTRQQIVDLGSPQPGREMQAIRKKTGMLILYVMAGGAPFWVAPVEAEANGVDFVKRLLNKL
ncbi:MAG: hypothetical protein FWF41_05430 [Betaproteobacteria bacterium]|nr:hypothetical protein [Betaproteobacteria bacterium]